MHSDKNPISFANNSTPESSEALAAAIMHHHSLFLNMAYQVLEPDWQAAEDVVQNVAEKMLNLFEEGKLNIHTSFTGYIGLAVKRAAIRAFEAKNRYSTSDELPEISREAELFFGLDSKLVKALEKLRKQNEFYHKAWVLTHLGYTNTEITEYLGGKDGKVTYWRAKKRLAEILEELPDDPNDEGPNGFRCSQGQLDKYLTSLLKEIPIDKSSFESFITLKPPYGRLTSLKKENRDILDGNLITGNRTNSIDESMNSINRRQKLEIIDGYFKLLRLFGNEEKTAFFLEESKKRCFNNLSSLLDKKIDLKRNCSTFLPPSVNKGMVEHIVEEPIVHLCKFFDIKTNKEEKAHALIPVREDIIWGAIIPTSTILNHLEIETKEDWVISEYEEVISNQYKPSLLQEINTNLEEGIKDHIDLNQKQSINIILFYGPIAVAFKDKLYRCLSITRLKIDIVDKNKNRGVDKTIMNQSIIGEPLFDTSNQTIFIKTPQTNENNHLDDFDKIHLVLNEEVIGKQIEEFLIPLIPNNTLIKVKERSYTCLFKSIQKNDIENQRLELLFNIETDII